MQVTKYNIKTDKIIGKIKAVCVSDTHGRPSQKAISAVRALNPDVILLAGDIMEVSAEYMSRRNKNAIDFLSEMSKIAPCFYCFGNHELYFSHAKFNQSRTSDPDLRNKHVDLIKSLGIHIINDTCEEFGQLLIGGVVCGYDKLEKDKHKGPNIEFLEKYSSADGFKILLCHYPHYYEKYLKNKNFDLILSGHAHGGQWRLFGRGVYAPHQGLFPKYTSGIYDGRFIINRGAVNNAPPIPRFFNPCEIIEINIVGKQ